MNEAWAAGLAGAAGQASPGLAQMNTTHRLLLLSKRFTTDSIQNSFQSSLPFPPDRMNVAIVPTASAEWKANNRGAVATYEYFSTLGFRKIDFVDIEFQSPRILADYDLIFFSGGNPFYLLWHLQHTDAQTILKELYQSGTYMAGSSAGAMIWGKDIRTILPFDTVLDRMGLRDFSGLGCIPYAILPHADFVRQQFADYNESLKQIKEIVGVEILEINNGQGALFIDGVLRWV